ncbi:hypothetical protein QLX08_005310 [Tetragonisca angustula]|uniref:Reverse transcriptase n=1 Tax=Tetragonisca angustula TaxID=166442 RepID=A0AAW0ZZA6_9HYME
MDQTRVCPSWVAPPSSPIDNNIRIPYLDDDFSLDELNLTLRNLNANSAPGPDQIDNNMIIHLPLNWKQILLDNINNCYKAHTYQREWTESNIKLIPKPNK